MLQYTLESICNTVKALLSFNIKFTPKPKQEGPNTLEELLKQFDLPVKEKTQEDIIRDYMVRETMAALELEMLKMDPARGYLGSTRINYEDGTVYINFVPCIVRPDVLYCSYGKN